MSTSGDYKCGSRGCGKGELVVNEERGLKTGGGKDTAIEDISKPI